MRFPYVKMTVMWRVISAYERVREPATQHVGQLLLRLAAIVPAIELGIIKTSRTLARCFVVCAIVDFFPIITGRGIDFRRLKPFGFQPCAKEIGRASCRERV